MKIERDQFKRQYAERSGLTVEEIERLGLDVYPCDCEDERCQGWQMLTRDGADTMIQLGLLRRE